MDNFTAVILCAGQGKRMNSNIPKVLHEVLGVPMIVRILREVEKLNPSEIVLVVGSNYLQISEALQDFPNLKYAIQESPQGTGNAVLCALSQVSTNNILVLCGDTPLITYTVMKTLIQTPNSVLGTILEIPYGYGRIIHQNNKVLKIVEQKSATPEQQQITLINAGIYYLKVEGLKQKLQDLKSHDGEYYMTDIFENSFSNLVLTKESYVCVGVNTQEQLKNVEEFLSL